MSLNVIWLLIFLVAVFVFVCYLGYREHADRVQHEYDQFRTNHAAQQQRSIDYWQHVKQQRIEQQHVLGHEQSFRVDQPAFDAEFNRLVSHLDAE